MKTIIIVSAAAFVVVVSAPAEARVDYYDGVRPRAGNVYAGGQIGSKWSTAPVPFQTPSGQKIEFSKGSDGRWWPTRSIRE